MTYRRQPINEKWRTREHPDDVLTPREVEILGLVVRGMTNREIGERLFLAKTTVVDHLKNVNSKTGCRSRIEAAVYGLVNGVVIPPDASEAFLAQAAALESMRAQRDAAQRQVIELRRKLQFLESTMLFMLAAVGSDTVEGE